MKLTVEPDKLCGKCEALYLSGLGASFFPILDLRPIGTWTALRPCGIPVACVQVRSNIEYGFIRFTPDKASSGVCEYLAYSQ